LQRALCFFAERMTFNLFGDKHKEAQTYKFSKGFLLTEWNKTGQFSKTRVKRAFWWIKKSASAITSPHKRFILRAGALSGEDLLLDTFNIFSRIRKLTFFGVHKDDLFLLRCHMGQISLTMVDLSNNKQ
ncbi:hypothetical protein ACJX0J_036664, partial [Zea mays]